MKGRTYRNEKTDQALKHKSWRATPEGLGKEEVN